MCIIGWLGLVLLGTLFDPSPPADICPTAIAKAKEIQQPDTRPVSYVYHTDELQPIAVTNAGQVRQIQRIGRGEILKAFRVANRDTLVLTTVGMWRHVSEPKLLWEYHQGVEEFTLSSSGKLIAAKTYSYADSIPVWDIMTGETILNLSIKDDYLGKIAFSPDETMIAAAIGQNIHIWDVQTGSEMKTLVGAMWIRSWAFSPDSKWIAAGGSGQSPDKQFGTIPIIRVWDISVGNEILLIHPQNEVSLLAFTWEGSQLVSQLEAWNAKTGAPINLKNAKSANLYSEDYRPATILSKSIYYPETDVYPLQFDDSGALFALVNLKHSDIVLHPNSKTVIHIYPVASYPTYISVCDLVTGERKKVIVSDETTNDIVFSPDERIMTINEGRGTVKLLDANTYDEVATFDITGAETWVSTNQLAYSPTGTILAFAIGDYTTGDYSIRLWDVQQRHELTKLEGHTDTVVGLAFSPDGKLLASSSRDGTIRLWGVPQT